MVLEAPCPLMATGLIGLPGPPAPGPVEEECPTETASAQTPSAYIPTPVAQETPIDPGFLSHFDLSQVYRKY